MENMTLRQLLDAMSKEIEDRFKNPYLMEWDIRKRKERGEDVPENPFRSVFEASQRLIERISVAVCVEDPVCWELNLWKYEEYGLSLFGDQVEVKFRKKRLVPSDPGAGFGFCSMEILKGEEHLDRQLSDLYQEELNRYRIQVAKDQSEFTEKRSALAAFLKKHGLSATEFYETYHKYNDVLYLTVCEESLVGQSEAD